MLSRTLSVILSFTSTIAAASCGGIAPADPTGGSDDAVASSAHALGDPYYLAQSSPKLSLDVQYGPGGAFLSQASSSCQTAIAGYGNDGTWLFSVPFLDSCSGPPAAVSDDPTRLFYAYDRRTNRIYRRELAAPAPTLFASVSGVLRGSLALDSRAVYWVDALGVRARPRAGGVTATLAAAAGAFMVGLDGGYVYYSSGTELRRVPAALPGGSTLVYAGTAEDDFQKSGIDPTHVYWFRKLTGLFRAPKGGGAAELVNATAGEQKIHSVASNGANVYFTLAPDGAIMRHSFAVMGGTTVARSGLDFPTKLHVSTSRLFWLDADGLATATLP